MALVTIKTEPESTNSLLQVCRLCLSEESLDDVFKEEDLHQWISDYLSITVTTEDSLSQAICAICRIRLIEFHQFYLRCQKVQDVLHYLNQNENIEAESDQLLLNDMLKYGCIECGKMFILRQHLDQHKKTHVVSEEQFTSQDLRENETEGSNVAGTNVDQTKYAGNTESQNVPFAFISSQLAKKRVKNLAKPKPKPKKKIYRTKVGRKQANCLVDMIDIEDIKIEAQTEDDARLPDATSEKPASTLKEVDGIKLENASIIDTVQSEQIKSDTKKKKTAECEICNKKYSNKLLLWSHRKLAHGPKNYKCHVCGVAFSNELKIEKHNNTSKHLNKLQKMLEMQKQSGEEKSNQPEGCNGDSETSTTKTNDNDDEYSCPMCNRKFKRQCQFKTHMRSHEIEAEKSCDSEGTENEEVVSDGSVYTSNSDQPPEAKEVLSDSSVQTSNNQSPEDKKVKIDKPFKCVSCHRSYDTEKQLKNHKRFHRPKKYICPICGKPFLKMYPLEMHIPSHNAVRDWQRGRNVSTERNKNVDKPHKCEICQTSYRTVNGYLGHKKQVHGPKIHECHLCPYKFTTRKDLSRHVKRHYHSSGAVI